MSDHAKRAARAEKRAARARKRAADAETRAVRDRERIARRGTVRVTHPHRATRQHPPRRDDEAT